MHVVYDRVWACVNTIYLSFSVLSMVISLAMSLTTTEPSSLTTILPDLNSCSSSSSSWILVLIMASCWLVLSWFTTTCVDMCTQYSHSLLVLNNIQCFAGCLSRYMGCVLQVMGAGISSGAEWNWL